MNTAILAPWHCRHPALTAAGSPTTLNLAAETFSRELHQLAHEGLIAIDRRVIRLLDHEALKHLMREFENPEKAGLTR